MDFIISLFNRKKIECPRCLGKGEVDANDNKRLDRELFWGTGPCAYCNGIGLVPATMPANIEPDLIYLTTDISQEERNLLIRGDANAMARAFDFEARTRQFIKEVLYMQSVGGMNADQIAEFYTIRGDDNDWEIKQGLRDYIQKILKHYNKS